MPSEFPIWKKEFWSPEAAANFRRDQELKTLDATEALKQKYALQFADAEEQRQIRDREDRQRNARDMLAENYKQAESARLTSRMNDETRMRDALTRYYRQEKGPDGNFYPEGGAAANAQYEMDRSVLGDVTPNALKGIEAGNRIPWSQITTDSDALTRLERDYAARMGAESERNKIAGGMPYQEELGRETAAAGIETAKGRGALGKYLQQDPELGVAGTQGARAGLEREQFKADSKNKQFDSTLEKLGLKPGSTTGTPQPVGNFAPPKQPVYNFNPQKVSYDIKTNAPITPTPATQPPDMNGRMKPSYNTTTESPSNLDRIQRSRWLQYQIAPDNE